MKNGLVPGVQAEVTFEVTDEMRPIFDAVPVHQVCSTWSVVHHMEMAGRKLLMRYLESHEEGVGSHVSCDHLGPAKIGRTVRVVATAVDVTERQLVCDAVACIGERPIAKGRTVQRIFPRPILERILKRG